MKLCGIIETEQIDLHEEDDLDQTYSIALTKAKHEPMFCVFSNYDPTWIWEFWNMSTTDYERVKMCILDIASDCEDIEETLYVLSNVFVECFGDMLVEEECECTCGGTGCNNHLN